MPNPPRYPPYTYSAAQWPQQLYYGPQYWGYPMVPQYTGPVAPANLYPYTGYPSPVLKRDKRRSLTPPPDVQTHLLLGGRYRPTCVWDISQNPSTARQFGPGNGTLEHIPADALDSPATDPAAFFMRIVCDLFPWAITIKVPRNQEVSVGMVLGAIHGTLQEPLEKEEWEEETSNNRKKMHRAMCARLARTHPEFRIEGQVKRIDTLGEKTLFLGLKPVGPAHAPEEWLLKLGSPQKKEGRW